MCLALTFIGPYIPEWINCNGKDALVPFPNGFMVLNIDYYNNDGSVFLLTSFDYVSNSSIV